MARALVKTAGQSPRNLIINGNFDFWQRNTSFAAAGNGQYTADRFQYNKVGTMVQTISRSTDVPTLAQSGFQSNYSILSTVTTAQSSLGTTDQAIIRYQMEGNDYATIHGQSVRLQFWVKASTAGLYSISMSNNLGNRYYVSSYTINAVNTWEKKTIDLTMDSTGTWQFDNLRGLIVNFVQAIGTALQTGTLNTWQSSNVLGATGQVNNVATNGATFQIAQVIMTAGKYLTDTSLVFKRAGDVLEDELAMCQRYYEFHTGPSATPVMVGQATSTTSAVMVYKFTATKRIAPTISVTNALTNYLAIAAGGGVAVTAFTPAQIGTDDAAVVLTVASGFTAGHIVYFRILTGSSNNDALVIDAEF